MKKRTFVTTLILILLLSILPVNAWGTTTSGMWGSFSWNIDPETYTLTLSGEGDMHTLTGNAPFHDWKGSITKIIVEEGITSIGYSAFHSCINLTEVSIPSSVTKIEAYAFMDCTALTQISIPSSVKSIGSHAFYGCYSLTSITIPDGVSYIEDGTFEDCATLISVSLPEAVAVIGDNAFKNCVSLTDISLPNGITTIGDGAFTDCSGLTKVVLPAGLKYLGGEAFKGTSLTGISIPDGIVEIRQATFQNCRKLVNVDLSVLSRLAWIGTEAFAGCVSLTSFQIPKTVRVISDRAFARCESLTELCVPTGARVITDGAFAGCSSLAHIELPEQTDIGDWYRTFYGCSSLKSVVVPSGVYNMHDVFAGCTSLEHVSLPESIGSIDSNIFEDCRELKNVQYEGNEVWWNDHVIPNRSGVALPKIEFQAISGRCEENGANVCWTVYEKDGVTVLEIFNGMLSDYVNLDKIDTTSQIGWTDYLTKDTLVLIRNVGLAWQPGLIPPGIFPAGTIIHYSGVLQISKCDEALLYHSIGNYVNSGISSSCYMTPGACTAGGYVQNYGCERAGCTQMKPFAPKYEEYDEYTLPHFIRPISDVEPTCSTTGSKYGFECRTCHAILVDSTEIPALGHAEETMTSVVTRAPTCRDVGIQTYTFTCGRADCCEITTVDVAIPAIGHDWKVATETILPTCTTPGRTTTTRVCTICKETESEDEIIPMIGHTLEDLPGTAPTCTESGETGGSWCSVCHVVFTSGTEVPPLGHIPGEYVGEDTLTPATCIAGGSKNVLYRCKVCGDVFGVVEPTPPSHRWGPEDDGEVWEPPTCTTQGKMLYRHQCSACGIVEITREEPIDTLEHTEEIIPGEKATCDRTGLTEGLRCSACGEVLVPQEVIPATGHDWEMEVVVDQKPTCVEVGWETTTRTCRNCGHQEWETRDLPTTEHTKVEIPAVPATSCLGGWTAGEKCSVCDFVFVTPEEIEGPGHDWELTIESIIENATCEKRGSALGTLVCKRCGIADEHRMLFTDPLGHDWGETVPTVTKEPTCTGPGSQTTPEATCSRCDATKESLTEEIPAIGHKWSDEVLKKETLATCTKAGAKIFIRHCTNEGCDAVVESKTEVIAATGHSYGDWVVTKEATGTVDGVKERTCSACGDKETETIPATGTTPGPEVPKVYKITFDANGGVGGATLETNKDNQLENLPSNPTRSGYTFDGWFTASTGGTQVTTSMKFDADTTVYAHWTKLPDGPSTTKYQIYTPDYTSGGSVYVSHGSAAEGTRITIELSPRSGYEMNWLSVVNLNTGEELSLTRRYDAEYTFIMPASSVEVEVSFLSQYTNGGYWYVPEQTPVSTKPIKWYFKDGQIWHVTDGLVPYGTLLTRDMLNSVLYNMDPSSSGEQVFWAVDYNIVPDIYASGLWGVDKNITREQAAMILHCYSRHMNYSLSPSATLTGYSDYRQMRAIAQPAMSWAVATGFITGDSSNKLTPRSTVTCGEANTILSRFLSTVVNTR